MGTTKRRLRWIIGSTVACAMAALALVVYRAKDLEKKPEEKSPDPPPSESMERTRETVERSEEPAELVALPKSVRPPQVAQPAESAFSLIPPETTLESNQSAEHPFSLKSTEPVESSIPAESPLPLKTPETLESATLPGEPALSLRTSEPIASSIPAESPRSLKNTETLKSEQPAEPAVSLKNLEPVESALSITTPAPIEQPAEPALSITTPAPIEPPPEPALSITTPAPIQQPAEPSLSITTPAPIAQPAESILSLPAPSEPIEVVHPAKSDAAVEIHETIAISPSTESDPASPSATFLDLWQRVPEFDNRLMALIANWQSGASPLERRRGVERLDCSIDSICVSSEKRWESVIVNLGVGGAEILHPDYVEPKTRLALVPKTQLIPVTGRVTWVLPHETGYRLGLCFDVAPDQLSKSWVAEVLFELGSAFLLKRAPRRYVRVATDVPSCLMTDDGRRIDVVLKDVSLGGCLLESTEPFDVEEITLRLGSVDCRGLVVNNRGCSDTGWSHHVHFKPLGPLETLKLLRTINVLLKNT